MTRAPRLISGAVTGRCASMCPAGRTISPRRAAGLPGKRVRRVCISTSTGSVPVPMRQPAHVKLHPGAHMLAGELAVLRKVRAARQPVGPHGGGSTDVMTQFSDGAYTAAVKISLKKGVSCPIHLTRFALPDFKTIELLSEEGEGRPCCIRATFFNGEGSTCRVSPFLLSRMPGPDPEDARRAARVRRRLHQPGPHAARSHLERGVRQPVPVRAAWRGLLYVGTAVRGIRPRVAHRRAPVIATPERCELKPFLTTTATPSYR